MRISVFGLGYVGSATAACLAGDGHRVIGVDVNPLKVEQTLAGRSPVMEPGLEELISSGVASGDLRATVDAEAAVLESDVSMLCVGTPSRENGGLDLRQLERVCAEVGDALRAKPSRHTVVVRSTVLPGTLEEQLIPVLEQHSGRRIGPELGACVNPEFLREGSAVHDYRHPSFVVVGASDARTSDEVSGLYARVEAPLVRTDISTAEMVKYASNAFHAVKVAFANEIGVICKEHGIDGQELMDIFCRDQVLNISRTYLRPGYAFGGSCLPKDLRALGQRARARDVEAPLIDAAIASNARHLARGVELVERYGRRRIGVLGLSFKPGTDDVRESPAVALAETLVGRGYQVAIYDERVAPDRLIGANRASLERELPHIAALMRATVEQVIDESDVVVITSDAASFRSVSQILRDDQVLVDLAGVAKPDGGGTDGYVGICW
jgi:GDP-mannose 6-dehydrogenase